MNVTALVDTTGTVLERVVYDPYGNPTFYDGSWTSPSDTSSYDNVVLYCGYYHDAETGLYHVRHRSYHLTLGRWLQRDPTGYGDGMSLYQYTLSAPSVYQDPYGSATMSEGERLETLGEVRLHPTVQQRHGTVEGHTKPPTEIYKLFKIRNESDYPHHDSLLSWLLGNARRRLLGEASGDVYIHLEDFGGSWWYGANFYAQTRQNPKFGLQMSTSIRVSFEIENVCCISGAMQVVAACNNLKNAFCHVPDNMIYYLQPGERLVLPKEAYLGANWHHHRSGAVTGHLKWKKFAKEVEAKGDFFVKVRCVKNW